MIQGTFKTGATKIDGFIIGEVIIDRTGTMGVSPLRVHYALANSKTATLFGKTTKSAEWSAATLQKLSEFLQSIENDIAADVFEESGAPVAESSSNLPLGDDGIPGL